MSQVKINEINTTNVINRQLPKDILKPVETHQRNLKSKNANEPYKTEDLIKLHEFKRENIQEPFKDVIENKDFFAFTNENDEKYNFTQIKYMVRSKLMLKAMGWSFGVGTLFFMHRYYRKKQIKSALRWGFQMWGLSFYLIWGSFELQPFISSVYYSKFIENLSAKDHRKYSYINYEINQNEYENFLNTNYGIVTLSLPNPSCAFSKFVFEYDNEILKRFNYPAMKTEKIISKNDSNLEKIMEDDFSENKIYDNEEDGEIEEYNFSFHKQINLEEDCIINSEHFLRLEGEKLDENKKNILKADVISNSNIFDTKEVLKREIKICEDYLKGNFYDFENDPHYKKY
jgi:hypothetical protein